MKKITALLLALSMIFLCACSDNNTDDSEPSETAATTIEQTETTKAAGYITEWESDLLPADFPSPPANTYGELVSILPAESEYSGRCHEITRLIFTCPENNFYNFANGLGTYGFFGGMKKMTNATFYSDGFWGAWRGNKYSIIIGDSAYADNGDLKICLDIVENFSAFPEALKEYFPEFAFPARTMGIYAGCNSETDETNNFYGKFEHIKWQWHVRFRSAFIGVSLTDFQDYCDKLGEIGFAGTMETTTVDGCNVITCDLIKNDSLAAIMMYNQILKTLDVIYTNDPKSITG